ncbi:MAG: heme ABC exporter ATP-binding protein CcmA [Thermoanaerobaculia bacterium]
MSDASPRGAPVIQALALARRFGRRWALAHIDLEVQEGEALLLTGPNGSGKTTLLRLLVGLLAPSHGELRVFGLEPARERVSVRRRTAVLAHDLWLYPRLSAGETLRLWRRLGGERSATGDGERRVAELLAGVSLGESGSLPVGAFSAGMRKRLALARLRAERPRLLLLDEPFAALDAEGKALVAAWLAAQRAEGVTLIVASHALERAVPLCDRAVRLEAGQLVWRGAASELAA